MNSNIITIETIMEKTIPILRNHSVDKKYYLDHMLKETLLVKVI